VPRACRDAHQVNACMGQKLPFSLHQRAGISAFLCMSLNLNLIMSVLLCLSVRKPVALHPSRSLLPCRIKHTLIPDLSNASARSKRTQPLALSTPPPYTVLDFTHSLALIRTGIRSLVEALSLSVFVCTQFMLRMSLEIWTLTM